jgi:hypothetical protein
MNSENSTQTSGKSRAGKIPLKGFCHEHNRTLADFVCESCRIFYCRACSTQHADSKMRCNNCGKIFTELKRSDSSREDFRQKSDAFTGNDIPSAFNVSGVGFLILCVVLALANFAETKIYWGIFLLSSAYLIRRIKTLYDNRTESDFKNEDGWQVLIKPVLSGALVSVFCFAVLFFIGYKFYDASTYLKMVNSEVPLAHPSQIKAGIADEFDTLRSFDDSKFANKARWNTDTEQKKLMERKSRAENAKQTQCVTQSVETVKTGRFIRTDRGFLVDEEELQPKMTTNEACAGASEREIAQIDEQIKNAAKSKAENSVVQTASFWYVKKLAGLFVIFLLIGAFYYPLGLTLAALTDNVWDSINFVKGLRLARVLASDYAGVFFAWLIFLMVFALTVYIEFQATDEQYFQTPRGAMSSSYYVVKIFAAIIRTYLLVVMANMVGKMLYKNKFKLKTFY